MKRHSRIEVATKLHQATEMARRGGLTMSVDEGRPEVAFRGRQDRF